MNFRVRTRARELTHGVKAKALLFSLLPAAALLGAAVSTLLAVLCGVYGAGTVFDGYPFAPYLKAHPALCAAAPLLFGIAAGLFALFHRAFRFALQAVFFYRTAPKLLRPGSFLSFGRGARILVCDLLLAIRKLGMFMLLLTPCLATLAAVILQLRTQGIAPALLAAGLWTALAQFICAAAAAFVINGRYYLTKYLLYLNPLLPARDAIRSSALLMHGRLSRTARCRFCALPWLALRLFWPTRPFAFAYTGMLRAALCEALYTQEPPQTAAPSVRFFTDRNPVFDKKNPTKKIFK